MTRPTPGPDVDLAQLAFEELGQVSFADASPDSVLQKVTDLAARVLPGEPVTSVTIVSGGRSSAVAASGRLAVGLDRVQYAQDAGPCLEAATSGRVVELLDTRTEQRWGDFPRLAAERGCRGPVLPAAAAGAHHRWAQRVRAHRPAAGRADPRPGRFAAYAVVPVSNAYLYRTAVERAGHLQAALDSRSVIDQATGILMERSTLSADQAFSALARVPMETDVKVRDIAERFVETGQLRPG